MEPMYIYALLHLANADDDRRERLERHFVSRDRAHEVRLERLRRLRRRFTGRPAARPATVELAVR